MSQTHISMESFFLLCGRSFFVLSYMHDCILWLTRLYDFGAMNVLLHLYVTLLYIGVIVIIIIIIIINTTNRHVGTLSLKHNYLISVHLPCNYLVIYIIFNSWSFSLLPLLMKQMVPVFCYIIIESFQFLIESYFT